MSGGEITLFVIVLSGPTAKEPWNRFRQRCRTENRENRENREGRVEDIEDMGGGEVKKKREREICKEKQEMAECREGNAIHLLNLVLTQLSHSRRCTTQVLPRPPPSTLSAYRSPPISTRHRYIHACTFQMPFSSYFLSSSWVTLE